MDGKNRDLRRTISWEEQTGVIRTRTRSNGFPAPSRGPPPPNPGAIHEAERRKLLGQKNNGGNRENFGLAAAEEADYESSSAKPEGPVGIQLHGNRNMGIDYKGIVLKEL